MKFTLGWLKEHLDTKENIETISKTLTAVGLEVEEIIDRSKEFEGLIVADVVECEKHPDADRLNLCLVNTGKDQLQVVCGAPNVRKGLKVCFAPVDTRIPAWDDVLKKGVIRGKESNGMICSEAELCLSDESKGIMELDTDAKAGTPFAKAMGYDDPIIEIALTPNRADCAGVHGIARDLAAAGMGALKPYIATPIEGQFDSPVGITLDLPKGKEDACPYIIGRYIRGVKNGPSPKWMQDRLIAAGLRPISALVDITNYICLEFNRPLHVFDAAKLKGNITIRMAKEGEKFLALNEKEYTLDPDVTVVADNATAHAMGGVMGGEHSGASDDTTDIFVEIAYFDPDRTRLTGSKYQIASEAKYRFERGVDPAFLNDGAEIATRFITEICGGEASKLVIAGKQPETQRSITFDPSYVKKLGGIDIKPDEQIEILLPLGFEVKVNDDKTFGVTTPTWRVDVEGRADLVEEILRIHGYDKVQPVSVTRDTAVSKTAFTPQQKRQADILRLLASRGLYEAVTWSFTSAKTLGNFGYSDKKKVTVANPLSSDLDTMRHTILGNLVEAVSRNAANGYADNNIFEVGPVFFGQTPEDQPDIVGGIRSGQGVSKSWADKGRGVDVFDAKADVAAVLEMAGLNPENIPVTRDAPSWYHPGRSGVYRLGKNVIATFGELHPALAEEYDLDVPVALFEIFLENLPTPKSKGTAKPLLKISPLQPVTRDFAFVVDEKIEAMKVMRAAAGADKKLISDVHLFDVYQGKGMEDGQKSLAITVTLQPFDNTLTEEQLDDVSQKIIANVEKQTGGVLRG